MIEDHAHNAAVSVGRWISDEQRNAVHGVAAIAVAVPFWPFGLYAAS